MNDFDRKTPIEEIAPNPKKIKITAPEEFQNSFTELSPDSHESAIDEVVDDDEGDILMEESNPVVEEESHENTQQGNIPALADNEGSKSSLPTLPLSRLKAFLHDAFPEMQIGKQPLELIRNAAMHLTVGFVAGCIQQKIWSVNDPRYLEGEHLRLTREDGVRFLDAHQSENPWGLFAQAENWQCLHWREIHDEDPKPFTSHNRNQPLITNFFRQID